MAIIPMPTRRAQVAALRHEDRFPRTPEGAHVPQPSGVLGLIIATAMVAGCVVGLLAYDAQRPLAKGAANAPIQSLAIFVEPAGTGESR